MCKRSFVRTHRHYNRTRRGTAPTNSPYLRLFRSVMSRKASYSEDEYRVRVLKWVYYVFSNDTSIFLSIKIMKHHADRCGSKTNLEIAQQNIENEPVCLYVTETLNMIFLKYFSIV